MTQGSFDIDFIAINQIAYTFNKLVHSNNKDVYRDQLVAKAKETLKLMDQYQAIHPSFSSLTSYLSSQGIADAAHLYNDSWAARVTTYSESFMLELADEIKGIHESYSSALSQEQASALFDKVRKGVISRIIKTEYLDALRLLDKFASVVEFSNQPRGKDHFQMNRFVEFLFLKYVATIFSLVWFPLDDNKYKVASGVYLKEGDKLLYSSSSFKPLDKIYILVTTYQRKNESLFEEQDDETRYYWIVKFLNLSLLFKQMDFVQFHNEFTELFINQKEALQNLVQDTSLIKSNLLVMYGIVSIFMKPFNQLSLLNIENDDFVELYYEDPTDIEFKFYNKIVKPLGDGDNHEVKRAFADDNFMHELVSYLEYNLPVSTSKLAATTCSFIEYLKVIIDSKLFLVIMSSTASITKRNVLRHLGYSLELTNELELHEVSNHLLGLISALGLGQIGIGYLVKEQVFYNNGPPTTIEEIGQVQDSIDQTRHQLHGDSLAGLMTSLLIERLYN